MSDYSIKELEKWDKSIEEIAKKEGLSCYEQEFEIVSYEDMICYEAYTGMPSHYPHWSFGKSYERIKTMNKYNLSGLPYEMVINSNPCIAYLMKDNSLLLQILTIAHVYGHNDFFKNNRIFKIGTKADNTIQMFKNHARRVRDYIQDPGIGYENVERILNAAHALRFQAARIVEEKHICREEKIQRLLDKYNKPGKKYSFIDYREEMAKDIPNIKKIPIQPEEDILMFVDNYGRLDDWEKDLINIVREETQYFIPQIETKIMNEGWASFWHYKILNSLNLSQGLHIEFLKRHNQVIRPHKNSINPYYLGFKIFEDIGKKNGLKSIFDVRGLERDESFIRRYLTKEICRELNLFKYEKEGKDYVVKEVSDEEGWKEIRDTISLNAGMGSIPVIKVEQLVQRDNSLILRHEYDGRELETGYASETLKHLADIWDGKIILETYVEGKKKAIICDVDKKISLEKS